MARKLVSELDLAPGDTVEINARHTDVVTGSFTDELVIALLTEKEAGQILVRGTVPGMFSGIKENSLKHGYDESSVEAIPLSQRPPTQFI